MLWMFRQGCLIFSHHDALSRSNKVVDFFVFSCLALQPGSKNTRATCLSTFLEEEEGYGIVSLFLYRYPREPHDLFPASLPLFLTASHFFILFSQLSAPNVSFRPASILPFPLKSRVVHLASFLVAFFATPVLSFSCGWPNSLSTCPPYTPRECHLFIPLSRSRPFSTKGPEVQPYSRLLYAISHGGALWRPHSPPSHRGLQSSPAENICASSPGAMHIRVSRSARVERITTSCGECRRRKQKASF